MLLVLGWMAFVPAVFWGLFFAPALAMRGELDSARVLAVGEAWWRQQGAPGGPAVVLLAAQPCPCGSTRDGLASGKPLPLRQLAADAELVAALRAALPATARLDTLVFDASGRLQLAFDRHDTGHCLDARLLLETGVSPSAQPLLWPGLCACP